MECDFCPTRARYVLANNDGSDIFYCNRCAREFALMEGWEVLTLISQYKREEEHGLQDTEDE